MAVGLASILLTRPPDIVISDLGRFVAARAPGGDYYGVGGANERIVRQPFRQRNAGRAAALAGSRRGDR